MNNISIRERSIENEKYLLCEHACKSSDSRGRRLPEADCPIRTDFQRDRDRIIHSSSFRRLKHKTQVFLFPKSDHYRTRLTHTLEVAQIARTIARALRLNEDLTEAIALGHDLGHTPFGHDGERVLNRWFSGDSGKSDKSDAGGFFHNRQSVRVAEVIERDGAGLNLTAEVLDGFLNHSSKSKAFTREGEVVRMADKIAYINHDIEDAVSSGVLDPADLPKSAISVLGDSKSRRITSLIVSIVNTASDSVKSGDGMRIEYDSVTGQAHDELRKFMFERVYNNPKINTEKEKAVHVLEFLCDHYVKEENHHEMPTLYRDLIRDYGVRRGVCDYISGMTDDFAIDTFKELCVPKAWRRTIDS
ncbi:MAG: deoxyguanosinetriphosphate triphosphohydrolase [Oscillospiraceae bacterium]|jgi:dGTPase|nr:deoxyguanosinetriphosphate triphosphohydrolase [Oscillospiraceae bacterium]